MAKREISILIRAKNMIARGLIAAGKDMQRFGATVSRISLTAGKWLAGIGVAVTAVGVKAVAAYAQQEAATASMKAALRAYGEEVAVNVRSLQKLASEIQNETAVGDEVTLARMARMRMLGMETRLLGPAAKGVIALAQAGMEEDAAMKALVAAHAGEYGMLGRYLPALKTATNEAQKAAIVNDFLTKGYAASKEKLHTVTGAWAALKGRIGDAWEELGAAIAQNESLVRILEHAGEAVRRFGDSIKGFVESEKFKRIREDIDGLLAAMMRGGNQRSEAVAAVADVIKAAFGVAVERARSVLLEAAPRIGRLIGAAAKAAIGSVAQERDIKKAAGQLGIKTSFWDGTFGWMGGFTKEQSEAIRKQVSLNREQEAFAALGVEAKANIEGQTAAEYALTLALQRADAVAQKSLHEGATYEENRATLQRQYEAAQAATADRIRIAQEGEKKRLEEIERRTKRIADLEAKRRDVLSDLRDAQDRRMRDSETRRIEEQIARMDMIAATRREIAELRVGEFIERQRVKKEQDRADHDDLIRRARLEQKARTLEGGRGLGGRMGHADREWLDAARNIDKARREMAAAEMARNALQKIRDFWAMEDHDNTRKSRVALEKIERELGPLLRAK